MSLRAVTLLAVLGLALTLPRAARAARADARLLELGDEFLTGWMERHPALATHLGVHTWDGRLLPITSASVQSDLTWLAGMRGRLALVPRGELSFERAQEYDLLSARIERERIELAEVRSWERDPSVYVDLVAGSVFALLERDFASPCERVMLATRRLRAVPEVLRAASLNLKRPPRLFTEMAISQSEGALDFYRRTLPALAAGCRDPRIQADLAEADTSAVRAVEEFLRGLLEDVLPRSDSSFALGADLCRRTLAAEEMETTPLDSLLARGFTALDETRARMAVVAERIAPGLGLAAALDSLGRDAPGEGELVAFVTARLGTIRAFLGDHALLTVPASEDLDVRETPSFRRGLSLASLDAPGVWERRAPRAFLDVTPADSQWSEPERRDHLAGFNRAAAQMVAIREAVPGHYGQLLALQRVRSRLRQALPCGTTTEGWAHYCEQMMIEQGYGAGDPRIELAQLALAQRSVGRLIAGISLQTGGMSLAEAQRLFEERCFMAPADAAREARRSALDPTAAVATLGKWRILELREETRRALGASFRLREFHDLLLSQGGVPLPLARAAVLRELARRHPAALAPR